jgi:predicted RNA-binding protein (virulence factor B family)
MTERSAAIRSKLDEIEDGTDRQEAAVAALRAVLDYLDEDWGSWGWADHSDPDQIRELIAENLEGNGGD